MTSDGRTLRAHNDLNATLLSTIVAASSSVDMFSPESGTLDISASTLDDASHHFTTSRSFSSLSSSAAMPPLSTDLPRALWTYCAPLIFVIGIVGNVLILVVMSRQHMRGTTTSIYLRWMAAADLCTLITGMITEWFEWYLGPDFAFKELHPVACKLEKLLFFTFSDTSIWICVAFTVDRFFAVCFPLDRRRIRACSKKTAHTTVIVAAIAAVAKNFHFLWTRGEARLPLLASTTLSNTTSDNWTTTVMKTTTNCGKVYGYFEDSVRPWIALILVMAVPFVIIAICNFFIVSVMIRLRTSRRRTSVIINSPDGNVFQMTALCLSASLCFLVCVTPSMILLIGKSSWQKAGWYAIAKAINNQVFFINHSINFFLYCLTGQRFRRTLFMLCRCIPGAELDRFFSTDAAATFGFGPLSPCPPSASTLAVGASGLTAAVLWRTSAPLTAPPCRRRSTPNVLYVKKMSTFGDECRLPSTGIPLLGFVSATSKTSSSAEIGNSFPSAGYLVDVDPPPPKYSPKPAPSSRKMAAVTAASAIASKTKQPVVESADKIDDVTDSRRKSTPVLWYAELQRPSTRRPSFETIV